MLLWWNWISSVGRALGSKPSGRGFDHPIRCDLFHQALNCNICAVRPGLWRGCTWYVSWSLWHSCQSLFAIYVALVRRFTPSVIIVVLDKSGNGILDKSGNGVIKYQSSYEYEEDDEELHIYAEIKEISKDEIIH